MTAGLRVTLIVASFLTLIFMARKVRSSKIRLEDSIFWFCFAILLLVVSIFPGVFYLLSAIAGTISVANFVFLFFIFILLISCFSLSVRVSQLDTKLRDLTQQLAIERFERYSNDKKDCEAISADDGLGFANVSKCDNENNE
ncbi:DUF2304 domain-containing protein [[Collinsella] massiliensis]|uniref:Glycosyl transferase n=1 Tax=[Collinsella] massiliensis TaxID=1232426 RepID=A0A1Y3XTX3_9ACTN|nr:DUF2304 domain-containing protein [[Collinsella] massiliensis]OUN89036.1 glycosyl transferase [[Collinsella] massiliensis]